MAKKTKKADTETTATETAGADALPAASSADSGIPLHSVEVARGPIESGASDLKAAHGLENVGAEKAKGKVPKGPVLVKSRVPAYTKFGQTFSAAGTVVQPDDFTDEQWAVLGESQYLVITKAGASDSDY